MNHQLDPAVVVRMVRAALDEDGVEGDATIAALNIADATVRGRIVARQDAVIAGGDLAAEAFTRVDAAARVADRVADGTRLAAGEIVMAIEGPARSVIGAERVALNFLQRLSGIATLSARFVDAVAGTGVTILDTRKTTPLWRDLEKYAVRCGGAENHRRDLESMVLIKENHIRAAGGDAVLSDRLQGSERVAGFVEVEVDSLAFLETLLGAPIDRVMLDNFTPEQVGSALELLSAHRGVALEVEVSGGVTLETVRDYALPGVDCISVGALTHSAPSIDLSLEVV